MLGLLPRSFTRAPRPCTPHLSPTLVSPWQCVPNPCQSPSSHLESVPPALVN